MEELFGPVVQVPVAGVEQPVETRLSLVVDAVVENLDQLPDWLLGRLRAAVQREALMRSDIIRSQTAV